MKKIWLLILLLMVMSSAEAKENRAVLGIQYGPFVPSDWKIQGKGDYVYSTSPFGAGNASDIAVYLAYAMPYWQIRFESGARLHSTKIKAAAPSLNSRNAKLNVYPATASAIFRTSGDYSKQSIYLGAGAGFYFASWREEIYSGYQGSVTNHERWEGSSNPFGIHALVGFDLPFKGTWFIEGEVRYSYISSDWKLEDKVNHYTMDFKNLNIGGTTLRFGAGYKFR